MESLSVGMQNSKGEIPMISGLIVPPYPKVRYVSKIIRGLTSLERQELPSALC